MHDEFRRTGRTTHLFEEAISLLAELPEGARVFVTGAHTRWLIELERDFKASGLVDVLFFTPDQIARGACDGQRGVLLIDDFIDLPERYQDYLIEVQRQLNWRNDIRRSGD